MKNTITHFILSFIYTIFSILCMSCALKINVEKAMSALFANGIFITISRGFYVFSCLLVLIGSLTFTIGAILHMVLMFYHAFFAYQGGRQINVTVDENYIIRDSFLELSNGKIIPINIKKIVMNKPQNDNNIVESGESNE